MNEEEIKELLNIRYRLADLRDKHIYAKEGDRDTGIYWKLNISIGEIDELIKDFKIYKKDL